MPQLGQLAVLMAVITPCFPSMSLIHLTAFFPLCCSPSILIKPELNDQRWLGAGAHPSQHVDQRRDLRWLLFICSGLQVDQSTLSLCGQCMCTLKLKRTFMDVMEVPFIDVWCTASNVQNTSGCSRFFHWRGLSYWRKYEQCLWAEH